MALGHRGGYKVQRLNHAHGERAEPRSPVCNFQASDGLVRRSELLRTRLWTAAERAPAGAAPARKRGRQLNQRRAHGDHLVHEVPTAASDARVLPSHA